MLKSVEWDMHGHQGLLAITACIHGALQCLQLTLHDSCLNMKFIMMGLYDGCSLYVKCGLKIVRTCRL